MEKKNYLQVEKYYDEDASNFDSRYYKNPVLQRIRQDMREEVKRFKFSNVLEIGFGTGIDIVHFARTHPDVQFSGIDISGAMCSLAKEKVTEWNLKNVDIKKGTVEDIESLFKEVQFDMIYVFFGALNTVDDINKTAKILNSLSSPGGIMVLSFVNKYYLAGVVLEVLKLRFRKAFSRLNPEWGGYSPSKYLPSSTYSIKKIKKAFGDFLLIRKKGYSIIYPAWYYKRLIRFLTNCLGILWKADKLLNKTPLWCLGEYSLCVFQKPDNLGK
jgi:ubiquinone/menaquinone biosynthesis C-methylase UbiE